MIFRPVRALVALLFLVLVTGVVVAAQRPVPQIRAFQRAPGPGGSVLHVLVGPDRGVGWRLGMVFECRSGARPVIAVFLGPFPADPRRLQLAVRGPDGVVERFGDVFVAAPGAGFNDTYLEASAEQRRFARAALRSGALVSNGYNSFYNRASAVNNRAVLDALARCGL